MDDEQALRNLYERTYKAMIAKDERALREVHADDFILVHMTGMKQTRAQYIDYILRGTLNYFTAQTEQMSIAVDGDSATLRGRSRVEAAVFGGGRHTWRLQLSFKARKTGGVWRFTRAEASTY